MLAAVYRRLALIALLVSVQFVRVPVAAAHFGSSAYMIVTEDHVLPGQEFEIVAADLTPNATVAFRVARDDLDLTVPLTTTTAPADGHFRIKMAVPEDFPRGYAQLFATAGDGTEVSTWVLIGTRTSATPLPPGTAPWWSDPSVIVLVLLLVGTVGLVAWMVARRVRSAAGRPAAATVASSPAGGRRDVSSKSRRARKPRG